jgi:hypothetical protein
VAAAVVTTVVEAAAVVLVALVVEPVPSSHWATPPWWEQLPEWVWLKL